MAETSGLGEPVFRPVLSKLLLQWVSDFNPSIVFCEGYSLSLARLPLMLHKELGLPLCFFTGDDWPETLYRTSPFSPVLRPILKRATEDLLEAAVLRYANGPDMASEYKSRYGHHFETLMLCDESARFDQAVPKRDLPSSCVSVLYSGGLTHRRWESVVDLCDVIAGLAAEGIDGKVTVHVPSVPAEAADAFARLPNLRILPPPAHEEVPGILKGADILLLCESFDKEQEELVRLSISTKAHLYMMSQRPILAYGGARAGVIRYAKRDGWAAVVDSRDRTRLEKAVRQLVRDGAANAELLRRARSVAARNHEATTVRERLRQALAGREVAHG
jgi:hypothetical protein